MGARAVRSRWLGLLVWVAASGAWAQDSAGPADLPGELQLTDFRAAAFAQHLSGDLLWLGGPGGILRVEIRTADSALAPAAVLAALLGQQGEGWTAVLAGQGNDTFNAWGDQWRRAPAGLAELAQLLRTELETGPPARTGAQGPWRARSQRPAPARHRIPALAAEPTAATGAGFRADLARHGAGRSPAEEIVELDWREADGADQPRLEVRSTVRPGALSLGQPRPRQVVYAMPEAFVPLWPLSELVSVQP